MRGFPTLNWTPYKVHNAAMFVRAAVRFRTRRSTRIESPLEMGKTVLGGRNVYPHLLVIELRKSTFIISIVVGAHGVPSLS